MECGDGAESSIVWNKTADNIIKSYIIRQHLKYGVGDEC